jgi:hypothetical protein
MSKRGPFALIVPENFIQATRDSGYKSLASALAELIDNSFEAKASSVHVCIEKLSEAQNYDVRVIVADNGRGMEIDTLAHALQFGWSSRFNQRSSHGRYGMGLPNASLSHARRVEVYSASRGRTSWGVMLDVDDVASGRTKGITPAQIVPSSTFRQFSPFRNGTVVIWSRSDRLRGRKLRPMCRRLRAELGRLFRYQLWAGKRIVLNGEAVLPFDPLFERHGLNLVGARPFGPQLSFEVAIPDSVCGRTSVVSVRFIELPIVEWHSLSNEEKNSQGIAKNAGVSIVRAGREIDRGWFFMGQKRKENYDDWWRSEVRFESVLDELFGVTHTKQEIRPTETLLQILVPDMERIARELNGRARKAFIAVKSETIRRESEKIAARHDNLIEPPTSSGTNGLSSRRPARGRRGRIAGLEYRLRFQRLDSSCLYQLELNDSWLTVVLNEAHPFVRRIYSEKRVRGSFDVNAELMILAAARAELSLVNGKQTKEWRESFRQTWSNILSTYLT